MAEHVDIRTIQLLLGHADLKRMERDGGGDESPQGLQA
jgi:hypothetical protein